VTATRRFANNLEFGANWTWSKAMDYSDADWGNLTTLVPIRVWNYGLAGFDRTHIVKANWLYDLPKFKTSFKPAQAVLNGWQMSGIASFVSGAPSGIGYSLVTPVEVTGTPSLSPRIVVTGNPVLPKSDRTFSQNFRTDVFQPAAVGTIGNAATTLVRGPGINNWDIGVFKTFHLGERVRAQFRAESYNTFNHTQFSTFDTTARFDANGKQVNAQLGQFTAARSPRQMQFALRLNF
jgi:hypothetical protein